MNREPDDAFETFGLIFIIVLGIAVATLVGSGWL